MPTQVVSGEIENFEEQGYKLANWIYDYRDRNPRGSNRSNFGGWQSYDKWFHETDPTFEPWFALLKQEIRELLAHYRFKHQNINLEALWLNINSKYSYNAEHTHRPTNLAGVLWVQVPPKSGKFVFTFPHYHFDSDIIMSTDDSYREEIGLHGEISVEPKAGKLILFPSYMPHRVDINESDEDRISIAFNLGINI